MKLKINIKARLQRHSRNRSSYSINKKSAFAILKKFKIISLIVIFILPIYPSFGAYGLDQETAVGNYDETTIITAYEGDSDSQDTSLFSKDSGFIKPNNTLDDTRDVSGVNKLLTYTVSQGDSLSTISSKFNISISSIIWANDLSRNAVLKPGMVIKIPPVSGVVYTVQAGDTIDAVASKFKIQSAKIQEQNKLAAKQELLIGQQLIIPGASRIEPPKAVATTKPTSKGSKGLSVAKKPTSSKSYTVKYTGKGNRFAWGNCTYFVANHKNVTWRGNANQWLKNAAAAGVSTGKTPAAGAIISFAGRGYNPYYGHVGIVAEVDGDELIIKDMNYRKLNEVTIRRISKDDPSIKGYIYVD